MLTTRDIGNAGETCAAEYLEECGYEILERNYKLSFGEIDIIALSPEDICVFVEVKTRKSDRFGLACEAVDRRKQEHIIRAAMTYGFEGDKRFDVIEVYYRDENGFSAERINHIENAFENFF